MRAVKITICITLIISLYACSTLKLSEKISDWVLDSFGGNREQSFQTDKNYFVNEYLLDNAFNSFKGGDENMDWIPFVCQLAIGVLTVVMNAFQNNKANKNR